MKTEELRGGQKTQRKEEQITSIKTGKTCEAVSEGKVVIIMCLLKEADVKLK